MKKFLIRSGVAPTEIREPEEMILHNLIGGNVGNLIYAYSIYRNLMTENVEIIPDKYRINENDADKINEEYDAYIIPLADAFRDTFVNNLKKYTKLFKRLNIPVIIIGVGVKAPLEKDVTQGFSFDKEVREFVEAVLERSSIIGVRGQSTADYLSSLGFQEGKDHMVIGCPSMYTFGRELKIKDVELNENSVVSLNSSKLSPDNILNFITDIAEDFNNYYFIPQWMKEFKMTYIGNEKLGINTDFYPNTVGHKFYEEGKVRFPLNAKKWIDFLGFVDLAVGARLHGNITATIAGTPSLLLTKDTRMKELADYHNLTHIEAKDLKKGTKLKDIIGELDFHSPEKVHKENFDKFIWFLNKNGLDHIYNYQYENQVPLDKKIASIDLPNLIKPINKLSSSEISKRIINYQRVENDKIQKLKEDKKELNNKTNEQISKIKSELNRKNKIIDELISNESKLNNEIKNKDKDIKKLQRNLNRKSVKIGLKFGDSLAMLKKKIKK